MDDSILFIVILYGAVFSFLLFMMFIVIYGDEISKWFRKMNIKFDYLLDKMFGGSLSFFNVTIHGRDYGHTPWEVQVHTKKYGYICFNLPIPVNGKIKKFYYFLSPDRTSYASTYYKFHGLLYKNTAPMVKECFGHNFDIDKCGDELLELHRTGNYPRRILRERVINDVLN